MRYLAKRKKLSKVLTHEREIRGLSQQDVTDAIGASLRNYQRWESGETFPQKYFLRKLQAYFGECINEIMIFDPQEHPLQADRVFAGDQEEPEVVPPQEEHIDQSSSETFSETNDVKTSTACTEPHISPTSQRTIKRHLPLLCTTLLILVVIGIVSLMHITNSPHPATIKPGGAWISPGGATTGDVIHFAAYAFPTHPGDPQIDHVNFTIFWQGEDPRTWLIACVAHKPIRDDLFACNANLHQLGVPAGKIIISFDVYDRQGNKNLAPNGVHTLIYSPTVE